MGRFTSTKNILKSKTFWFNVLTLAVTVSGFMPAKYAAPVSAIGNVILRLITSQPCTIFKSYEKEN